MSANQTALKAICAVAGCVDVLVMVADAMPLHFSRQQIFAIETLRRRMDAFHHSLSQLDAEMRNTVAGFQCGELCRLLPRLEADLTRWRTVPAPASSPSIAVGELFKCVAGMKPAQPREVA